MLRAVGTFVGRTEELGALAGVVRASAGPSAALITGPPGAGKSRLLAEVRTGATETRWLAVVGFETESNVPLAAAAGLLRALAAVPERGMVVDALAFGPKGGGSAAERSTGATLEPLRLFEAAHRALATAGPAVLVVDDLQWVDSVSLALCHYLVRAAAESQSPLAILAATRPGGAGEELFDALPEGSVRRIALRPLAEREGVALARALDSRIDPETARRLWRRAEGNPFWLEALARYGSVADGLEEVLTRRLRGADRDAAALLGTLSLAERPIGIDMAAEVLGREPSAVEAGLRSLVDRGLVMVDADGPRVAHDLIRATAVDQLPEDLRRRIHRGLADWWQREAEGDIQLLLRALAHRRAAGLPVLALARTLAASAGRRLLGADGARELAAVADAESPLDPETLALQADVAALSHELGEHAEALARWSVVADAVDDPFRQASAALNASRAAYALGRADEARELLDRSRALASGDPVLALEQLTHDAAVCLWLEDRGAEGRELAAQASSTASGLAPRRGGRSRADTARRRAVAEALRVEYEAAMQLGDPAVLLRTAENHYAAARTVGQEEALEASLAVAAGLRQSGRVRQAVGRLRRIWADANRLVLPRVSVDAGFWLTRTLVMVGELDEAEEVVAQAADVARRVGDVPRARHRVVRAEAALHLERGRVAQGFAALDGEISEQPSEHQRITLHADRAVWAARIDGAAATDAVVDSLAQAEARAASVGCPRCGAELLLLSAEAMLRIGREDAARDALDRRDSLGFPFDNLDRLIYSHLRALASESESERASRLREVVDAAGSSPYRLHALWIRLDLGRALAALGDRLGVAELNRTARDAGALGAHTVREVAERTLRTLGVRTWRRGQAGAPLTRRELELAQLAAGGATNREVASALFLSEKTVERHLVNVYRKLDVRNRAELAARLARAETYRDSPMIPGARHP